MLAASRRFTILSVSYPFTPVSEDSVGGAEQVLAMLDRALFDAGHRSIVVAPEGSRVRGELVPLPAVPPTIGELERARAHAAVRRAIHDTIATTHVDLIHMHGVDFAEYLPGPGKPVLATLHLPLDWYPEAALAPARPLTWMHCVSKSQHESAPPDARLLPPMPNGVDTGYFRPRKHKRPFALMLGRICPEKGIHIAIRACRAAGIALLIGGHVFPYPSHERYFHESVAPLLGRWWRFLGPLALARKARLLASASCLLIPSLAAETSSLSAMEALASGTPVVAFRNGALPELIENGRTGFLVEDEREFAYAIRRIGEISPAACREAAERRFSNGHTLRNYFQAYTEIIGPA